MVAWIMRLFDTHCHFETTDPAAIREILVRAKAAGVEKVLAVGGSDSLNAAAKSAYDISQPLNSSVPLPLSAPTLDSAVPLPLPTPTISLALGYDRDQADSSLHLHLPPPPAALAAIGEIGLDYHYSPETREKQIELFAAQLELAKERNLPVVIHTREADEDTFALLREIPSRGVIHCYTGSPEAAKRFLDLGFYISISGIVTFKSAENVRTSALVIPDDRILIETDAPFLAPVPMRGNPNEPAFIKYTCEFLAALRGGSAEDFAELTFENGERMLGLT